MRKFLYLRAFFCSDLPPSQGGRYAGFGNTVDPPPRSYSTNDFYDASMNGITNVSITKNIHTPKVLANIFAFAELVCIFDRCFETHQQSGRCRLEVWRSCFQKSCWGARECELIIKLQFVFLFSFCFVFYLVLFRLRKVRFWMIWDLKLVVCLARYHFFPPSLYALKTFQW